MAACSLNPLRHLPVRFPFWNRRYCLPQSGLNRDKTNLLQQAKCQKDTVTMSSTTKTVLQGKTTGVTKTGTYNAGKWPLSKTLCKSRRSSNCPRTQFKLNFIVISSTRCTCVSVFMTVICYCHQRHLTQSRFNVSFQGKLKGYQQFRSQL